MFLVINFNFYQAKQQPLSGLKPCLVDITRYYVRIDTNFAA